MITIETERLFLYPISDEEMQTIIDNEKDPEMKKAYSEMLQGCLNNPKDRVWYAAWYMELKKEPKTIVGDLCFKGVTDDGMVEIGYGLKEGYCGYGYMTEAVRAMTEWAVSQDQVSRVEAETDPDNQPSMKVLSKVGFIPTGEMGEEGPRFVFANKNTGGGQVGQSIVLASEEDRQQILDLYEEQKGREFCPWDEDYPSNETIDFDLSRKALFVMKEDGKVIAAISLEEDEAVDNLECWDRALFPGGELARVAVTPSMQNKGLARKMMQHGMEALKERGYKSIHFLVNKYNVKAIKSYDVFGFNVVGECHMYDQDFLCYEKEL